jgi:hypothetical protein
MSTVIDTTEAIIKELDKLESQARDARRKVESGDPDRALMDLQSIMLRADEAAHLIRREMKK